MAVFADNPVEQCPRCGASAMEHARSGFCSQCLAKVSLAALEDGPASDDELAAVLPASVLGHVSVARFGDYELLDEIARGGMGVVYRARQRSLNRVVALKTLLYGAGAGAGALGRFRSEVATAAALEHPNIVRILDVGEHDGQPYLAMDYVEGPPLSRVVAAGPLPARRAAAYVKAVAEAVHHAHERGILHRDLKPSNILLDSHDQPRVTDFGLAKRIEAEAMPAPGSQPLASPKHSSSIQHPASSIQTPDLTLSGQPLGSPNYMPPEQAAGAHRAISRRSDVYGLGATLYHLLTGRAPFQAATLPEVLHQVASAEPIAPRLLQPDIPRDLDTICLKCLEKDPARRYDTALELAAELGRFLHGESIRARPVGPVGKTWRWCRRKPALASALGAVAALLLTVAVGSTVAAVRIAAAREAAERENYFNTIAVADTHIGNGDIGAAYALLSNCPPRFRHWEWGRLVYQCHQEVSNATVRSQGMPYLMVDPQGRRAIAASRTGKAVAGAWDIATRQELFRFGSSNNPVWAMNFSPDGRWIAMVQLEGLLKVWDAETGREKAEFTVSNGVRYLEFNREGTQLSLGYRGFHCTMWDIARGQQRFMTPIADPLWIASVLDPEVRVWVTMDTTGLISLRDPITGQARHVVQGTTEVESPLLPTGNWNKPLYLSPDGRWLVANRTENTARVWEVATGREVTSIPSRVYKVVFSPDGKHMATVSGREAADVWEITTGQRILTLRGVEKPIGDIRYSLDGRWLFTIDPDWSSAKVRTWNATLGREFIPHDDSVGALAFSPDGRRFVTTQMDGLCRLWETDSGRELRVWRGNWNWCRAADFSPDGQRILTAGADRMARIWDSETGQERLVLKGHTSAIRGAVFSPDGARVATASRDNTVRLWDSRTGRELHRLTNHTASVRGVAFSPDGRWLVSYGEDSTPHIWDTVTGQKRLVLKAAQSAISGLAISPDGQRIVTGSQSGSIRVWSTRTGELLQAWRSRSPAQHLAFSPDGARLAVAASRSGRSIAFPTVDIWDAARGRQLLTLKGHGSGVFAVRFSPDGRRLLSGSMDNSVRTWEAFPWRPEDFTGQPGVGVRSYATNYWRDRLLAESRGGRLPAPSNPPEHFRIPQSAWPPRDPSTPAHLIDLSAHYNGLLDVPWVMVGGESGYDDDLSELPRGVQRFAGVDFDVRGVVQLQHGLLPPYSAWDKRFYPQSVRGIRVGARFKRFHALGATSFSIADGLPVGRFVLHYADGQQQDLPILSEWDMGPVVDTSPLRVTDRRVEAWRGSNPYAAALGGFVRLCRTPYENPRPEVEVTSLDFESKLARCGPFLVALTLEP